MRVFQKLTQVMMTTRYQQVQWTAQRPRQSRRSQAEKAQPSHMRGAQRRWRGGAVVLPARATRGLVMVFPSREERAIPRIGRSSCSSVVGAHCAKAAASGQEGFRA